MSASVSARASRPSVGRRLTRVLLLDIATISVNQAKDRWSQLKGDRFDAWFAQLDAYQTPLAHAALPSEALARPFDVVTMQFCMHYAFETQAKAECMIRNVTRHLRRGGIFVATIPNPELLECVHSLCLPVNTDIVPEHS